MFIYLSIKCKMDSLKHDLVSFNGVKYLKPNKTCNVSVSKCLDHKQIVPSRIYILKVNLNNIMSAMNLVPS